MGTLSGEVTLTVNSAYLFKVDQLLEIPYFFRYKLGFCPSQTILKNLDPSYKMDLDLWDFLGRVKLVLQQNFV